MIVLERQGEWEDSSEWLQYAKLLWKYRDKENPYRLASNLNYACQFDYDSKTIVINIISLK